MTIPSLSVIVPIYNEELYLEKFVKDQIKQLQKTTLPFELILSHNGSTDKTLEIANNLQEKYKQIKVISIPTADYGLAVKQGFQAAQNDYLVLFDLDYYNIDFIRKSIPLLRKYDAVIASKTLKSSTDQRSKLRQLSSKIFSLLLQKLFNYKLSDTHGIKILKRKSFSDLIEKTHQKRDLFDTALLIKAQYKNLKLTEIPIEVVEKRKSRSSIITRALRTTRDLFLLWINIKK